jgi:tetratricopeptide (TPR) repeat protein
LRADSNRAKIVLLAQNSAAPGTVRGDAMPDDGSGGRWSRWVKRVRESRLVSWLRGLSWSGVRAGFGSFVRAVPDHSEQLRKLVTSVALVGGIVVGVWIVVELSDNDPLVFDPLYVHADLAGRVPAGDRLALRIGTHFDQFTAVVERLRAEDDVQLARDADLPKLDIPGAEISVQALVQIVRRFIGRREQRIGGDVFLSTTSLAAPSERSDAALPPDCKTGSVEYVVMRLLANRGELVEAAEAPVCVVRGADGKPALASLDVNMVESLLQLAALRAFQQLDPCGSAAYYFHNWYRRSLDGRVLDGNFRRTSQMIGACIVARGPDEAGYAHHLLGRVRQASGRSPEAPSYFDSAERLHLRSRSFVRRALHAARLWRVHLPDLHAHWGSALLDVKKNEEALARFDFEIRYGSGSPLAYVGKGNALVEMAGNDRQKLAAAVAVYCAGARRHRYDAEIRHVLADVLERHPDLRGCSKKPVATSDYVLQLRRKAVDLKPTDRKYLLAQGRSLRAAGRLNEAVTAFNAVLHLGQEDSWEAYSELAASYVAMDRRDLRDQTYRRARESQKRLAEQWPMDAQARYRGALAALAVGDDNDARQRADEAVARDPGLSAARLALACAEWRRGNAGAARDQFAQVHASDRELSSDSVDPLLRRCVGEIERSVAGQPR